MMSLYNAVFGGMDSVVNELCYNGENFTNELQQNDHLIVTFL